MDSTVRPRDLVTIRTVFACGGDVAGRGVTGMDLVSLCKRYGVFNVASSLRRDGGAYIPPKFVQ
jgi:hypothetical protein